MMLKTDMGALEVPEDKAAAIRLEAHVDAERTVQLLQRCGIRSVPLAFMLELSAALRINDWERMGLLDQMGEAHELLLQALADFGRRLEFAEAKWRMDEPGAPLHRLTLSIWLQRFSWFSRKEFGADCMIKGQRDGLSDAEVEAIAQVVWALRQHGAERSQGSET